MATVHYTLRDHVAVIEFSNPPVNSFNHALRRDVMAAVERANVDPKVRAVVLAGHGGVFSACADVHELTSLQSARAPALPELVRAIESSSKPVVAAIEGDCLGGGLQLTLGCHYRIADHSARLGLPEVKLGLLPCAGGTQRLPRLCGIPLALQLIVSGDIVPASELARTPLLDHVVGEDALGAAVEFAANLDLQGRDLPRTRDRPVNDRNAKLIFDRARQRAKQLCKSLIAPLRAIDAIEASITQTFDEGIRIERSLFKQLHEGAESRALRYFFMAKRAVGKIADVPDSTPSRPIERAAVIGSGETAAAIAACFLDAGIPVRLLEMSDGAEQAGARIREDYNARVQCGKLAREQCDARLALLTPGLSYADFVDAEIVVEAVFGESAVKQHVFDTLDRTMKQGAILATSTSVLDVNRIARATNRSRDVLGLHFSIASGAVKLIEIVRGEETADDVLTTAVKLAKQLKKVGVVSRASEGFIGNRMLAVLLEQALLMVEDGASPYAIDAAAENFGFSAGPFRMCDVMSAETREMLRHHGERVASGQQPATLDDWLRALGRSGQAARAGWYDYEAADPVGQPSPTVEGLILNYRAQRDITPREVGEAEIIDRLVLALVTEGARILEDRTADRASDVDLVYVMGYGFPKWRGGPLFHADLVGLDRIARRMKDFAANPCANPAFWHPPFLLQRLAAEMKTFRSLDRPFSI